MKLLQSIPLSRFFAVGAIIVVSVLLAFWIDAWWDEAQQREREVILLQSLRDDLQRARTRLDTDRRMNEAVLESTITLFATTS